jgi:hypothetical protein
MTGDGEAKVFYTKLQSNKRRVLSPAAAKNFLIANPYQTPPGISNLMVRRVQGEKR